MIDFAEVTAILTALALLVGAAFAIRKYRAVERPDSIVSQQSTLLTDMRTLYESLEATNSRLRADSEADRAECVRLQTENARLRAELDQRPRSRP